MPTEPPTINDLKKHAVRVDELARGWAEALALRDRCIVALHAEGHSMQRIADEGGVTRGRVSQIIKERSGE